MSDDPSEVQATLRAALNLLAAGQHDQVDALLYAAQVASHQLNDSFSTNAVAAARQIYAGYLQCQADIAWYQQAEAEASQRERQLHHHMQSLLAQISGQGTIDWGGAAPLQRSIPKPKSAELGAFVKLRQLMISLFKRITRWSGIGRTQPPLSTITQIDPSRPPNIQQTDPNAEELPSPFIKLTPATATPPLPQAEETVKVTLALDSEALGADDESIIIARVTTPETSTTTPVKPAEPIESSVPSLAVYCLGLFRAYQNDQPIQAWPSNKGQTIFKYLLAHRYRPIAKEVLMELFWPEATPEAARNNLNVAIYGLRRALRQGYPEFSHVLFQNDAYLLNPALHIWIDAEEFTQQIRAGQRLMLHGELEQAIYADRAAEALYQGEFFEEDRYEDWILPLRQSLQDEYLTLLDRLSRHYLKQAAYDACILMCGKLLTIDSCREHAHRRLMRCYSRQGHHHLALRQYQLCVEALQRELEVEPDQATQALYAQIRQHRPV